MKKVFSLSQFCTLSSGTRLKVPNFTEIKARALVFGVDFATCAICLLVQSTDQLIDSKTNAIFHFASLLNFCICPSFFLLVFGLLLLVRLCTKLMKNFHYLVFRNTILIPGTFLHLNKYLLYIQHQPSISTVCKTKMKVEWIRKSIIRVTIG